MANSLNEDLLPGQVVVLKYDKYAVKDRRFVVKDGFGASRNTLGSALFGYWIEYGEERGQARIDGYEIDPKLTRFYWQVCNRRDDCNDFNPTRLVVLRKRYCGLRIDRRFYLQKVDGIKYVDMLDNAPMPGVFIQDNFFTSVDRHMFHRTDSKTYRKIYGIEE